MQVYFDANALKGIDMCKSTRYNARKGANAQEKERGEKNENRQDKI